jgi:chemotaxis protein methyltransferase CheR
VPAAPAAREVRRRVTVCEHDLDDEPPAGPFDLVLCRNVAFTYFAPNRQRAVLARLGRALRPGGALVIGLHEQLPELEGFEPCSRTARFTSVSVAARH